MYALKDLTKQYIWRIDSSEGQGYLVYKCKDSVIYSYKVRYIHFIWGS